MTQATKPKSRRRIANWLLKMRGDDYALDRAKILIDKGLRDEALRFLNVSNEVFQNSSELKSQAARFLFDLGQHEAACNWLRRGGIAEIDQETAFKWSSELEDVREHSMALELLQLHCDSGLKQVHQDPSETYYRISRLQRILGDVDSAIESMLRCLESGNYPNVLSMICSIQTERERQLLLAGVERAKVAAKIDGHYAGRLNLAISNIYKLNGDFENSAIHLGLARDEQEWKGRKLHQGEPAEPSFLVIGTMKSGTTGFYHTLCEHPQIYRALRKEVGYFSEPNIPRDWYMAHFPRLPAGSNAITGEATPNYFCRNVHDRIATSVPNAKLICLMRDPAKRAVSHYFHGVRHGTIKRPIDQFFNLQPLKKLIAENASNLESFLYQDSKTLKGPFHLMFYGLYPYFLRRWFRKFDASQILLLTLEDFKERQNETMARTFDFLGIDQAGPLELTKPYTGIYNANDKTVQEVLPRLNEFYEDSNRILFEEFGIQFGTSK